MASGDLGGIAPLPSSSPLGAKAAPVAKGPFSLGTASPVVPSTTHLFTKTVSAPAIRPPDPTPFVAPEQPPAPAFSSVPPPVPAVVAAAPPPPPPAPAPVTAQPEEPGKSHSTIQKAISEEIQNFESELAALTKRVNSVKVQVTYPREPYTAFCRTLSCFE